MPTFPFCITVSPLDPATVNPPANVEVAVLDVALKYGAPIFDHDSIPPRKVEVAVDLIWRGIVVVGVREFTPKMLFSCFQSYSAPDPVGHAERQSDVRQMVDAERTVVEAYGKVEAVVVVAVKYAETV
jgi:hypothetical protein